MVFKIDTVVVSSKVDVPIDFISHDQRSTSNYWSLLKCWSFNIKRAFCLILHVVVTKLDIEVFLRDRCSILILRSYGSRSNCWKVKVILLGLVIYCQLISKYALLNLDTEVVPRKQMMCRINIMWYDKRPRSKVILHVGRLGVLGKLTSSLQLHLNITLFYFG